LQVGIGNFFGRNELIMALGPCVYGRIIEGVAAFGEVSRGFDGGRGVEMEFHIIQERRKQAKKYDFKPFWCFGIL
jgi:hypothetical protein